MHSPLVQSIREPHGREREDSFSNEQATEDAVGCGVGGDETLGQELFMHISVQPAVDLENSSKLPL